MGPQMGWRMLLEVADLSDEPSPISHLRVPATLLPSAEWAPHCPSALDIPSHSVGFVGLASVCPAFPLAEGTQVISAMENYAMWSVSGEDSLVAVIDWKDW